MSPKYIEDKTEPAWFTVKGASNYSGLSTALLYELIEDGCIVSSTALRPGRKRGRRLINRASLDVFIEAGVGKKSADNVRKGGSLQSSIQHKRLGCVELTHNHPN